MSCHHIVHLTMPFISKWEWTPLGSHLCSLRKRVISTQGIHKDLLDQGKIRWTNSPGGAPILVIPKPHGRGLRLCVGYWWLNRVTITNRRLLPLMNKLGDRVQGARFFTKLDLKTRYHHIRVKERDLWKTTFCTTYSLFENTVMRFSLANAPATFPVAMETIFQEIPDWGLLIEMDDFLIKSETEEEHTRRVPEVLPRLKKNKPVIAWAKCIWHASRVDYLGYTISSEGIEMALDKIETILERWWLQYKQHQQRFFWFASYN